MLFQNSVVEKRLVDVICGDKIADVCEWAYSNVGGNKLKQESFASSSDSVLK